MPIDNVTLIFVELALGMVLAVIAGSVARFFRQPLILAYIATGILVSLLGVFRLGEKEVLPLLASFGVVFLLFLVGLELRITDIKTVGKTAAIVGLGQLILTFVAGFVLVKILGFTNIQSVYIGLALTFSSTIIVIKLLSEKKDLNSLYGKIAIGILLVQDIAAIVSLIFLSGFQSPAQAITVQTFGLILAKGLVVLFVALALNKFILPATFTYTANSPELLLITALSWCFIFASFTKLIGFSLEIGAFTAGVTLASSPYHLAISSKVKPMRDFFTVVFFIFLGTSMILSQMVKLIIPVLILSSFIIFVTPIIVLAIMGFLGHRKRTSFLTSIALAQISEFSLILVALGVKLGHIGPEIISMVAAIGIITIAVSSYLIINSNWLYQKAAKFLDIFERRTIREGKRVGGKDLKNHILLIGAEQVGRDLLPYLQKKVDNPKNIIIVDFNPEIIENLTADGFNAIYGDISDFELLEELNLAGAKLIISTVPDLLDNIMLIKSANQAGYTGPIIATAYWAAEAAKLYEAGADFVLVPELAGGDKVIRILSEFWQDLDNLKAGKNKFFQELMEKTKK